MISENKNAFLNSGYEALRDTMTSHSYKFQIQLYVTIYGSNKLVRVYNRRGGKYFTG